MSSFKILTGGAFASALLFGLADQALAMEIKGIVQDSLGRPIPGTTLHLRTVTARIVGSTKSATDGRFIFSGVTPGTYAVQAENPAFQPGTSIVTVATGAAASTTLTLAAQQALQVQIV